MPNDPVKVFVCYSHADEQWLADGGLIPWLQKSLSRFAVEFWWDREKNDGLRGGDKWRHRIFEEIDKAHLAILLISNDFASSDFIRNDELPRIQKRMDSKALSVIPILVTPVAEITREDLPWVFDLQVVPSEENSLISCKGDQAQWASTKAKVLDEVMNRVKRHRQHEEQVAAMRLSTAKAQEARRKAKEQDDQVSAARRKAAEESPPPPKPKTGILQRLFTSKEPVVDVAVPKPAPPPSPRPVPSVIVPKPAVALRQWPLGRQAPRWGLTLVRR